MYKVIKSGISANEAQALYPDNYTVLLYPDGADANTKCDLVYVGDVAGAFAFTDEFLPAEHYKFFILQGEGLEGVIDRGEVEEVEIDV